MADDFGSRQLRQIPAHMLRRTGDDPGTPPDDVYRETQAAGLADVMNAVAHPGQHVDGPLEANTVGGFSPDSDTTQGGF
jgi:hypothetical protein